MKLPSYGRQATVLRVLLVLSCLGTVVIGLIALAVYRTFTVGGDLRAARNVVSKELNVPYASRVEVSAHPLLVGLVRLGLSFVPLEPEARLAIGAVRGAEVGVYELGEDPDPVQQVAVFRQVEERMTRRGWSRVVAVCDRDDLVLVYAPDEEMEPDEVEAFVFVLNGRNLVMVAGQGNLEPVVELARASAGTRFELPFQQTGGISSFPR